MKFRYPVVSCEQTIRENPAPPHLLAAGYPLRRSINKRKLHPFIVELVGEKLQQELARANNPPFHAAALQALLTNLPNL